MKIGVIGDTHLGFAYGTPRQEDSFRNAKDAIKKVLEEKPDIIVQLGDMFHERVPKPEILAPGIEIFSNVSSQLKPVKLFTKIRAGKEKQLNRVIPPIVTIFGNHERRAEQYINPVQLVERSRAIYCMQAESIVIECGKERIGIHGLSAVPNNICSEALKAWNPKPFQNIPNIMLLHQNFKEVIPQLGDEAPSFADLPVGFDIYLCGDTHWRVEEKHPSSGAPIILAGSTVRTQLKKLESTQKKGVYILDFSNKKVKITFKELETPRDFIYEEFDIGGKKPSEILTQIDEDLSKKLKYHLKDLKPIVRYKLKGKLADGFLPTDLTVNRLIHKYEDKILVFIDKTKVVSSKLAERVKFLEDLKSKKISVNQLGLKILCEKLGIKDSREIEGILNALSDGDIKKAGELLG